MKKLSRRTLLRGAAGTALGLPFLEAMLGPRRTVAQGAEIPKRVIFFFSSCGVNPDTWWGSGGETDFVMGESLAPLERMRDDLVILDNLRMRTAAERRGDGGNGHDVGTGHCLVARGIVAGPMGAGEFGHLWDGSAGGISIDQHIGNHFEEATPFRSLEVGVKAEGIRQAVPSRISYRAPFEPVIPTHTAGATFDRVFAPLTEDTEQQRRDVRRRQLVLGSVNESLGRLRPQLGTGDQRRIDAHMDALSDITARLDTLEGQVCDVPERDESGDYGELGALQMRLMARAMACDLTRVGTIQWSTGQSGRRFSDLGHSDGHHAISHKGVSEPNAQLEATQIDQWYAERFALLLDELRAVEVGDGSTMLDHTAVVWVNEQERGVGNVHRWNRMPFVIGGGLGGAIRTGRKVDCGGRGHGDLYVALMNAMGVEGDTFGDPDFCTGPLSLG